MKKQIPEGKKWYPADRNLLLHVPSGVYHIDRFIKGRGRLRVSTGETNLARARDVRDEKINEWKNERHKTTGRKTIADMCEELLSELEKAYLNGERRRATIEKDRVYLKQVSKFFGDHFADKMNEKVWTAWTRDEGKKLKINLFDISKYLSKVLAHAHRTEQILRKPTIHNPDKQKQSGVVYKLKEIQAFLKNADPMLRDLFVIGAETGMRPGENQGLRWDWIRFGKSTVITLPASFTKTEEDREIMVSANVTKVLKRRRSEVGESPYVFPSPSDTSKPISRQYVYKMMTRLREKMGLENDDVRFHWLRHTFASVALLDQKHSLAEVAAYVGNSPAILFKKYLQKDAGRTKAVASSISLNLGEEE